MGQQYSDFQKIPWGILVGKFLGKERFGVYFIIQLGLKSQRYLNIFWTRIYESINVPAKNKLGEKLLNLEIPSGNLDKESFVNEDLKM